MIPLVSYCKWQFVFYKGGMEVLPDFTEQGELAEIADVGAADGEDLAEDTIDN